MKSGGAFGAIFGIAAAALVVLAAIGSPSHASAQTAQCPSADGDGCFVVVKSTGSTAAESFDFLHNGTAFSLADGEQAVFLIEDETPHTVTESPLAGWALDDIECTGEGVNIQADVASGSVAVTPIAEDGEPRSALCTFHNVTDGDDDPATPTPDDAADETPQPAPTSTPMNPPSGSISPPATGDAGGSSGGFPLSSAAVLVAVVFMAVCASATLLMQRSR